MVQVRKEAAMSKGRFSDLLVAFSGIAFKLPSHPPVSNRELDEWLNLLKATSSAKLNELLPAKNTLKRLENENEFEFGLRTEYGMAPVKVRAVMQILREIEETLSENRPSNTVMYWAVASSEPAGKPIEVCKLVPVKLSFIAKEDVPDTKRDPDFNCVSSMKSHKAVRYATQAKYAGGYLTYSDLGYLLGIHPAAISSLLKKESNIIVPLRGAECDIGQGVTHRKKIIELFLQMYTESQIAVRTGHSYESIENYIKEFGTVLLLKERGLAAPYIRKVTGRSTRLINIYLELIKKYSKPEYAFRLNYLRQLVHVSDTWLKKRGGRI